MTSPVGDAPVLRNGFESRDFFLRERMSCRFSFIDLDPKARSFGGSPHPILHVEWIGLSADIAEPWHETNGFFLDDEVGRGETEVHCDRAGHRPHWVVRRDPQMGGFSNGGYLAKFANLSAPACGRINCVLCASNSGRNQPGVAWSHDVL